MRKLYMALGVALLVSGPALAFAAGGAPMGSSSAEPRAEGRSEAKAAKASYDKGLKKRQAALALEESAAQSGPGEKRNQDLAKATETWEQAVQLFSSAVKAKDDFHQAYNELGHAYRKLGRYPEALAAYDEALRIEPNFAQAMEYVGEAYLGLNRYSDVKITYLRLFQLDRPLAGQLMDSLSSWAERTKTAPPQGVAPETVQGFLAWIAERKDLAAQTGEVSSAKPW
jgi:tetratricopeptide (TPR) repeat protein